MQSGLEQHPSQEGAVCQAILRGFHEVVQPIHSTHKFLIFREVTVFREGFAEGIAEGALGVFLGDDVAVFFPDVSCTSLLHGDEVLHHPCYASLMVVHFCTTPARFCTTIHRGIIRFCTTCGIMVVQFEIRGSSFCTTLYMATIHFCTTTFHTIVGFCTTIYSILGTEVVQFGIMSSRFCATWYSMAIDVAKFNQYRVVSSIQRFAILLTLLFRFKHRVCSHNRVELVSVECADVIVHCYESDFLEV